MNRKLLVIAMVPLLVGFAGAMAFSSYQGQMTKTITVNTGIVKVSENVECVGAYIHGYVVLWPSYSLGASGPTIPLKPIVLDGGDGGGYDGSWGGVSSCPTIKECYVGDWCGDPGTLSLSGGPIYFLSPLVSTAHFYLTIQYMAPGDWIELDLVDQAAICPSCLEASLQSSLTPAPGLAGDVFSGPSLSPASPFTSPTAGGWTWLQDAKTNPCRTTYVPGAPAPINVGPSVSANLGLEYCDSGTLAPGAPSGSALSPTAGPVTVGGSIAYTYLLIGFDESATDAMMGVSGSLSYVVTATSP